MRSQATAGLTFSRCWGLLRPIIGAILATRVPGLQELADEAGWPAADGTVPLHGTAMMPWPPPTRP